MNTPKIGTRQAAIRRAVPGDIELVVPLFDAYRQFYGQPSEPERVRSFLLDRLRNNQSVIFLASVDSIVAGFTQLYPSFSSGAMAPIFILNDLFVSSEARRCGVGSALLHEAAEHGRRAGAVRLVLSTEASNTTAQSLYETTGWKRNTAFYVYELTL